MMGGKVLLSEGNFSIAAAIALAADNLVLEGQGSGVTGLEAASDLDVVHISAISPDFATDCAVIGLTITGASKVGGMAGVFVDRGSRVRIEDIVVTGAHYGIRQKACFNTKVRGVHANSNGAGFRTEGCSHCSFDICEAFTNDAEGFDLNLDGGGAGFYHRLVSCRADGNGQGGTAGGGFKLTAQVGTKIIACGSTNEEYGHGIYAAVSAVLHIIGCTIGGSVQHGVLFETTDDSVVQGCLITDNDRNRTASFDGISLISTSSDNMIIGNRIWDNHRSGVTVAGGCDRNLITGNNFDSLDQAAAVVDAGTDTIDRNNAGHATETSGTGTIPSAGPPASVVIAHGCDYTPAAADIVITPTENPTNTPGLIWVDTIGAANFTVNCENDPGASALDFSWAVRKV